MSSPARRPIGVSRPLGTPSGPGRVVVDVNRTIRRSRTTLVSVVAAVVLAVVLGGCATGGGDGDGVGDDPQAGGAQAAACGSPTSPVAFDRATGLGALPVWSFTDLSDPGTTVCTTAWEGMPTVVNFWATWCGFCVEEMPDLQAASEQLAGEVRFVGVDVQDNREDALAFLDETGVTYDSVADPEQQDGFYGELGNRGMPTTLFVDGQGTITYRHTGPVTTDQVLELAAEHLGIAG